MENTNASKSSAKKQHAFRLPRLSSRMLRAPLAVFITAFIYEYLLGNRNPCFALIGAIYGTGSQFQEGFVNGFNRFIGTLVGGLMVIPFYYLYMNEPYGIPDYFWLTIGLGLVIWFNLLLGADSAIQPGTVVYFVVMFTVGQERVVTYTIARIIDTGVGAVIALLITILYPSPEDRAKGLTVMHLWEEIKYSYRKFIYGNMKSRQMEQEHFHMDDVELAGEAPAEPFYLYGDEDELPY